MGKKNFTNITKFIDIEMSNDSLPLLKKPFLLLMAGSSQSGKTSTVLEWLMNKEKIFESPFEKTTFIYQSVYQQSFKNPLLKNVEFTNSLENFYNLKSYNSNGHLMILDDALDIIGNDEKMVSIATKDVHHTNTSVIILTQSIFYNTPIFRVLKDNTTYFYLKHQVNTFKLKYFSNHIGLKSDFFIEAYEHVMSKNRYNGLLIDLNIKSDLRSVSPLRYDLLNECKLIISEDSFQKALSNGVLKKQDDTLFILDV